MGLLKIRVLTALCIIVSALSITFDECLECSDLLIASPWGPEIFNTGQLKTGCTLGFACGDERPLCKIGRRMRNNKEFFLDGDELRCARFGGVDFQIRHLTDAPTFAPSFPPTIPTNPPTVGATAEPTVQPSVEPTGEPSVQPTGEPTLEPTVEPSAEPTAEPSAEPTTVAPTVPGATNAPSAPPTNPPTSEPTSEPTNLPTSLPTNEPTQEPSAEPTLPPTNLPTNEPTLQPTDPPVPTAGPTLEPTSSPVTPAPTRAPTNETEFPAGERGDLSLGTGGIVMVSAIGLAGFVVAATLIFVVFTARQNKLKREKAQRREWIESMRKDILGAPPAERVRYTFSTANEDYNGSNEGVVVAQVPPPPPPKEGMYPEYYRSGDRSQGSFDSFFGDYTAEFGEEAEHRTYPMDI